MLPRLGVIRYEQAESVEQTNDFLLARLARPTNPVAVDPARRSSRSTRPAGFTVRTTCRGPDIARPPRQPDRDGHTVFWNFEDPNGLAAAEDHEARALVNATPKVLDRRQSARGVDKNVKPRRACDLDHLAVRWLRIDMREIEAGRRLLGDLGGKLPGFGIAHPGSAERSAIPTSTSLVPAVLTAWS